MRITILFVSGFILIWAASRVFRELSSRVQECRFLGNTKDICEYRLVYGILITILLIASSASLVVAIAIGTGYIN